MTFAGLTMQQMLTLFGALGGAMVLLYILKLRRRRVEVPFSPIWERVVEERQTTSLFRVLKRFFSLLVQLTLLALIVVRQPDRGLRGADGGAAADVCRRAALPRGRRGGAAAVCIVLAVRLLLRLVLPRLGHR